MTKKRELYKCALCGNIVEVLDPADGELVCCGEPMTLLEEKTADKTTEKHVPIIQETSEGIKVIVGSTPHPMDEKHFIEWIEVINGDYVQRKRLHPGEKPEAEFYVPLQDGLIAREYCNVHGLWKS